MNTASLLSEKELTRLPEARATLAYTRYVLDTGNRGDLLDLHVALSPCMVGYGEIANWLDDRLADVSPSRFEQLTRIFRDATRLEIDFWEMGLNLSD